MNTPLLRYSSSEIFAKTDHREDQRKKALAQIFIVEVTRFCSEYNYMAQTEGSRLKSPPSPSRSQHYQPIKSYDDLVTVLYNRIDS